MKDLILNHNLLNPDYIEVFRMKDNTEIGSIKIDLQTYQATNKNGNIKVFPALEPALDWLVLTFTTRPGIDRIRLIYEAMRYYKTALYSRANPTPGILREFNKRLDLMPDQEIIDLIDRLKVAIKNNANKYYRP